jgi:hypothetical protein
LQPLDRGKDVTVRLYAAWLPVLLLPFLHSIGPVPATARHEAVASHHWYAKCPVPFSGLRVVTLSYWGFDHRTHVGQMIVNAQVAPAVARIFGRLYEMRFPIHHMALDDEYGTRKQVPADGDVTYSMSCRAAVPSPCTGGTTTHSWSMHAYGEAIDINPVENPYVGCGMTRDKTALSYLNRGNVRRGMVTPAVVKAFASVGWGWGGGWFGSTKDYMHFSDNGH